jgi:Spy/CpxP family protein refolding chaperone
METENHEAAAPAASEPSTNSSGWRKRLAIGGIAVVALSGLGVARALSDGRDGGWGWGGPRHHFQELRGGPHGHMGGMGMMGERGLERLLDAVGATPEQADKLRTIFGDLRDEMRPLTADLRDSREDVAKILGAGTIDRAAAEKLRSERFAELDQASQKVTTALLDAAEVLTPEQRAKIVEHFGDHGPRGRW